MRSVTLHRRAVAWVVAAVAGVTLASLWTGTPASAHGGGSAIFDGRAGPYQVFAYDGEDTGQPDEVAYTVIVRNASNGAPVDDADVTVSARSTVTADSASQEAGPVTASSVGNVYRYVLPDPGDGRWEVTLTVKSDAGTGAAAYELHGPDPATQPSKPGPSESGVSLVWLPIAGVGALLVLTFGFLAIKRVRRSAQRPPTTQAKT